MLMSKLYNKATKSNSSNNDPRVITPSSIPIFILPPTLDKIAINKTELNDSYDCWSILDDDQTKETLQQSATTDLFNSKLKKSQKSNSNLSPTTNNANNSRNSSLASQDDAENNDFVLKKFHNQLRSSPVPNRSERRNNFFSSSKQISTSSSLENLNILNKQTHRKSLDEQSDNLSRNKSSNTKSLVKTLFRSGFLNMQTVNNENDEIRTKENYCNLWVLNSDNAKIKSTLNLNKSTNEALIPKSVSYNNFNFNGNQKNEEKLQREYLVNLLLQLQNEKDQENLSHAQKSSKKSKRSKSETLLTIVMGTAAVDMNELNEFCAINNIDKDLIASSKRSNSNSSNRYLSTIPKTHHSQKAAKSGLFLEVNTNTKNKSKSNSNLLNLSKDPRRFSFRNLFKSNPFNKSCQQQPIEQLVFNSLEIPFQHPLSPSNSSSLTTNSNSNQTINSKFVPIKFHSFKFKLNSVESNDQSTKTGKQAELSTSSKAMSDPNVNKIFVQSNLSLINRLNVSDKKASFRQSTKQDEENDFDQIFSDYMINNNTQKSSSNSNSAKASLNNSKKASTSTTASTATSSNARSYKNIFNFFFKSKSNSNNNTNKTSDSEIHTMSLPRRSRTLDSTTKSKLKFFLRKKNSLTSNKPKERDNETVNMSCIEADINHKFRLNCNLSNEKEDSAHLEETEDLKQKNVEDNSNQKENEFNLNNLNLFQMSKDFRRKNKRRSSSLIKSNETLYLDADLIRNKTRATLPVSTTFNNKQNLLSLPNESLKKSKTIDENIKFEQGMNSNNSDQTQQLKTHASKSTLNAFIEVSFEKLQQHMNGHLISISIRNLRVEPLIEINYIKAKMTYLTLELVEPNTVTNECDNNSFINATSSPKLANAKRCLSNSLKKKQLLAKINKIKSKKCKFDNNLKNFSKPIDFDLINEHFMSVTEEAMNLQMKKLMLKPSHVNSINNSANFAKENEKNVNKNNTNSSRNKISYVFLLTIELHSYLPISRKILSSTFRKKKKIFKGQCQIHENFINSTQFSKSFVLNEM